MKKGKKEKQINKERDSLSHLGQRQKNYMKKSFEEGSSKQVRINQETKMKRFLCLCLFE